MNSTHPHKPNKLLPLIGAGVAALALGGVGANAEQAIAHTLTWLPIGHQAATWLASAVVISGGVLVGFVSGALVERIRMILRLQNQRSAQSPQGGPWMSGPNANYRRAGQPSQPTVIIEQQPQGNDLLGQLFSDEWRF